ncbi:hypothetical protein AC249_AIPGENE10312 [Exaiptasia diaphana]|nr:hypothetical protein AC249_AIPGENE10312 [Exaiptasia diaphana]
MLRVRINCPAGLSIFANVQQQHGRTLDCTESSNPPPIRLKNECPLTPSKGRHMMKNQNPSYFNHRDPIIY